ncbi:MAG TPA: 30S ribosomal protein S1 [Spirochaetota bacterium]
MSEKMTEQFDDSMTMESLLESSPEIESGQLFKGEVVSIDEKYVYVNIGRKNEGCVPVHEFDTLPKPGDSIDVVMRSGKLQDGLHPLSHRAAKTQAQWASFVEKGLKEGSIVRGSVKKFTGKGAIISLDDITAFLPLSHAGDIRLKESEGKDETFSFKILGIDPAKHSVIVSRTEIVAEEKEAAWQRIVAQHKEGDLVRGKVSRFVDFGAFVDLGGFEALLHNNDLTWRKVYKKKKIIQLGEEREFLILSIKKDEKKISLGLKQLSQDPWADMASRYPEGTKVEGVVTTIANFGVFVEIEDGIEGLVIPSECGWAKRPMNPKDSVKKGDHIAVVVTGVDTENRKLSLSIRLAQENPWDSLERKYPVGTVLKKPVKRIVSFGVFVEIENDIDGLIHVSDVNWDDGEKNLPALFKVGQEVEFKILAIDKREMRISCGIKQLTRSPWEAIREKYPPRSRVTGTITNITSFGLFVKLEDNVEGLVHISEASRRKVEDLNEIYKVGETVSVVVLNVDTDKKKMSLSIKHHDMMSEKEELKKIMTSTSSSTATIGDLLKLKQDGKK